MLGISQGELSRLSRVSEATIANFERGATEPQARTLHDLRTAFEARGVEFMWTERGCGMVVGPGK